MNQKKTVDLVLQEFINNKLIRKEDQEAVTPFLDQLYASGFDCGRTPKRFYRPVMQMSLENRPMEVFESMSDASRQTGTRLAGISICTREPGHTAGGFKWKHINKAEYEYRKSEASTTGVGIDG